MSHSVYTLQILHYVFLGTGICFLILSIFLFFKLDIRKVVGYLTGISEKKEMAEIESKSKGISSRLGRSHNKTYEQYVEKGEMDITEELECLATQETMVLDDNRMEETLLLYPKDVFYVESDITLVHTNETIRGGR
ncbi:hypothetical protein lbkm_0132 [Lachnospiraceae bacterium KM106-2]|nr:hypothetical protein lbkm_0132 [Lachnospiraceae bacterium KM106-2]